MSTAGAAHAAAFLGRGRCGGGAVGGLVLWFGFHFSFGLMVLVRSSVDWFCLRRMKNL